MRSNRRFPLIARVLLTWFVLVLGVSILSPALNPKVLERLCAADGTVKLVERDESGDVSKQASHAPTLDCPLCVLHHLPPPNLHQPAWSPLRQDAVLAILDTPPQPFAALSRAPLPARGPPAPYTL